LKWKYLCFFSNSHICASRIIFLINLKSVVGNVLLNLWRKNRKWDRKHSETAISPFKIWR
jgi:hypothetical protein